MVAWSKREYVDRLLLSFQGLRALGNKHVYIYIYRHTHIYMLYIHTYMLYIHIFYMYIWYNVFSAVQLLSHIWLFVTLLTAARQASLSITNIWSLPKLMSLESVMPSNHLILCRPLLLLPSIFPSIMVFSQESALRIRWPKYWISAST